MPEPTPLSGFFRVIYFLAATVVTVAVVATAITTFADSPDRPDPFEDSRYVDEEFRDEFEERQDAYEDALPEYERDTGLVLSFVGTAVMAAAILALGSRFNALRSGLLLGGLLLFIAGVGGDDFISFDSGGPERSDVWTSFLASCLAFVAIVGSCFWIENGLPTGRLSQRASEPPAPPGPPPLSGPLD